MLAVAPEPATTPAPLPDVDPPAPGSGEPSELEQATEANMSSGMEIKPEQECDTKDIDHVEVGSASLFVHSSQRQDARTEKFLSCCGASTGRRPAESCIVLEGRKAPERNVARRTAACLSRSEGAFVRPKRVKILTLFLQ
jgi:hypothetical protein